MTSGTRYSTPWLTGFIADLPTPFDRNDELDWASIEILCEHQIKTDATAIVVGETMALASDLIWCSQSISNDAQSISSLRSNGVGRSAMKPVNHGVEYRVPLVMTR